MKNYLLLSLLGFFTFSCLETSDEFDEMDIAMATNMPISANAANGYSFVLIGDDFSLDQSVILRFDSAAFALSVTATGYSAGSFSLAIFSEDSTEMFEQEITSNLIIAEVPSFQPRYLHLNAKEFSGIIEVAMGASGEE